MLMITVSRPFPRTLTDELNHFLAGSFSGSLKNPGCHVQDPMACYASIDAFDLEGLVILLNQKITIRHNQRQTLFKMLVRRFVENSAGLKKIMTRK